MKDCRIALALRPAAVAVAALSLAGCGVHNAVPIAQVASPPLGAAGFEVRRAVGIGPIVHTALGGQIFGWNMNENGNDAVLSEAVPFGASGARSAIETFDQTTGKITKIVAEQRSASGNHELVVGGVVAHDVGLIDDERLQGGVRRDIFRVMAPVAGEKLNGRWNPPHDANFLVDQVADQQSDPEVAILATINKVGGGGPEILVSNVAKNRFDRPLRFPSHTIFSGLYIVAEDVKLQQAVVPTLTLDGYNKFIVFHLPDGKTTNFEGVREQTGAAEGIAIDSATHMMCITTNDNFSVVFYDLKTHKGAIEQLPGAVEQRQDGAAVTADPVNHLFLVTQPLSSQSPSGGSTIYVYSETGALDETINGFEFSNVASSVRESVEVNGAQRRGYVNGPAVNELQEFTY